MEQNVIMDERRRDTRYKTLAKVAIKGNRNNEAFLKDISVTGCCLELPTYMELKPNARYKLKIMPEDAAKIESFFLSVEGKWGGAKADTYEFGFRIIKSPKGKHFQRYVDYLSWRYSQGNSMTGNSGPEISLI